MINPKYAVKCLKLEFLRYQRYRKLPISVEVSNNTISFYAKNRTMEKGKNARVSNHHLSMGRFAEKNEPWLCDNISIVFIVPGSPQDKHLRPRLYQNAEGSIKEFDVKTYPYNPNLLEQNDLSVIFQAIAKYLESGVYDGPFKSTDKEATPMPRHSNIKPYKGRAKKLGEVIARLDNALLTEIGQFCVSQYLLLNEDNQKYCNINMKPNKKVVRLTESKLKQMIAESVREVLRESDDFIGHGYKTLNNFGGNEIQISDRGDAARLKLQSGEITDWLEIEFDEEGIAYVTTPNGDMERLDEYMRFH